MLSVGVGPAAQLLRSAKSLCNTDHIRPGKPPDPLSCGQGVRTIILTWLRCPTFLQLLNFILYITTGLTNKLTSEPSLSLNKRDKFCFQTNNENIEMKV